MSQDGGEPYMFSSRRAEYVFEVALRLLAADTSVGIDDVFKYAYAFVESAEKRGLLKVYEGGMP